MNLSVLDRVVILTLLPKQGDFATLKILHELRMNLAFTEREVKKFGVVVDSVADLTSWEKDENTDIPLGEKATDIIIESFKKADREKTLSLEMMDTYKKFITTE